jgi:hypothetical protein
VEEIMAKKKQTKKKRKELAEIKWEKIVEENWSESEIETFLEYDSKGTKYKELLNLKAYCSFCHELEDDECIDCPLKINNRTCTNSPTHPYLKWIRAKTPKTRLKYAKIILQMIRDY